MNRTGARTQPCLTPFEISKGAEVITPSKDKANHMPSWKRLGGQCEYLLRATDFGENDPECFSVHRVEGLCELDEDSIKVHPLLNAIFLDLSHWEDHIDGAAAWSEATL